jgi:DDE superfamily endonuclease
MPAQQRLRRDHKHSPTLARQQTARRGEQHTIAPPQRWARPPAAQHCQLMPEHRVLDLQRTRRRRSGDQTQQPPHEQIDQEQQHEAADPTDHRPPRPPWLLRYTATDQSFRPLHHHANLFDRVEAKTGIEPFGRLVEQVMGSEPYASARTVYWIVDNGSSHAGKTSIKRMQEKWENAHLIHLPIHASWLNQIELYFSIVQRKALTPNDFHTTDELAKRLLAFAEHYRQIARPFQWTFTRQDLDALLARIDAGQTERQRDRAHLRLAA